MTHEPFRHVRDFTFEVNRAERTQQVRILVPLLNSPAGRAWFLDKLGCPCTEEVARKGRAFHLAFPLRDLFTADFYQCRDKPDLEAQLIAYYNALFDLSPTYGAHTIWRRHPDDPLSPIRHPAAPGRSGWHRAFLAQYVPSDEVVRLMRIRQLLNTETDALLILERHVVIIECKYLGRLSEEQYRRQMEMGPVLAERLGKDFFFGLVVKDGRSEYHAQVEEPYVTWGEVEDYLAARQDT
jgi:hypothetical protein